MGAPKSKISPEPSLAATLERLLSLTGRHADYDPAHDHPDTVEEAVRRLKGRMPEKVRRTAGD